MEEKRWMAIYTRPRSEKKVAERLESRGTEIYCPLQTTYRQWSDRRKKVKVPIFPSYVFVHVAEAERKEILMDPGVLNFVFWLGKPAYIKPEEIQRVKDFIEENHNREFSVEQYKKGDEIEVPYGVLAATKGKIEEIDRQRVTLIIEGMGVQIKVRTSTTNIIS